MRNIHYFSIVNYVDGNIEKLTLEKRRVKIKMPDSKILIDGFVEIYWQEYLHINGDKIELLVNYVKGTDSRNVIAQKKKYFRVRI